MNNRSDTEVKKPEWVVSKQGDRVIIAPSSAIHATGNVENGDYAIAECFGPDKFENAKVLAQSKEMLSLLKDFVEAFDAGNSDDFNLRDRAQILIDNI